MPEPARESRPLLTNEERESYFDGMKAGIKLAATLSAIYEGQSNVKARILRAGLGTVQAMKEATDA